VTRPHVLLSVAVSLDGYIDDPAQRKFPLSNADDFDRVDQVRAESDAILIGAETVRRDNPRLLVYSPERRAGRVAGGLPEYPLKVTVTSTGNLDPGQQFWHCGGHKVVYTTDSGGETASRRLGELAEVVPLGPTLDFGALLDDLGDRGTKRLMVEGGSGIHTAFLSADLVDEIHLAVAPLVIGRAGPRFLNPADFPGGPARRFHLADITKVGDVAVLRYFPKQASSGAPAG
jgi:5-amino-6-(5-phosphoribosylamino)uracil reductase